MKYQDEYRDKNLIMTLSGMISGLSRKDITLMEVCGGHTYAIQKFGIPTLLPGNIRLVSGPGCPVCVTSTGYIDTSVELSRRDDVIITTYGDLLRVPGSLSTLEKEKAGGAAVQIVYSPLQALQVARENKNKKIIFLGIGFETTSPASAVVIEKAGNERLENFFLLSAHKIMPPAMKALINEGIRIDGYICPGHVSTITGSEMYRTFPEKYGVGCVISGFEPLDIMQSVYMLVKQIESGRPCVEIQYSRVVKPEGNRKAKELLEKVFMTDDDWWRGFGIIPGSGYALNKRYERFDATKYFKIPKAKIKEKKGCICGEILKGLKTPRDCSLFSDVCNPVNPVGACMVSPEGACQAYYKFKGYD
jgi:hydrogenase expression/formation protein HypD